MDKVWTKEEIKALLQSNDRMVLRSLLQLYERQTDVEKENSETVERNFIGFNAYDADTLTSVAKFFKEAGFLTPKQIAFVRTKLMKYAGQLTRIANHEV